MFSWPFCSPSFDLPYWASARVYAKQSPIFTSAPLNRNPLNLWHFAFQPIRSQSATPRNKVELVITC
jgi:hypothetical protein